MKTSSMNFHIQSTRSHIVITVLHAIYISRFSVMIRQQFENLQVSTLHPYTLCEIHKPQYQKAAVNPLQALTWVQDNIHSPTSNAPNSKFLTCSLPTKTLKVFWYVNRVVKKCTCHNQNSITIQTKNMKLQNNPCPQSRIKFQPKIPHALYYMATN